MCLIKNHLQQFKSTFGKSPWRTGKYLQNLSVYLSAPTAELYMNNIDGWSLIWWTWLSSLSLNMTFFTFIDICSRFAFMGFGQRVVPSMSLLTTGPPTWMCSRVEHDGLGNSFSYGEWWKCWEDWGIFEGSWWCEWTRIYLLAIKWFI